MLFQIILLILGFIVLIKGADWLVNGSVSIAKHYKISELAIGLTIVAFGTSAPELVVSIISSVKGYTDVTLGNIVGSNLFNLLFILGVSGLVYPIRVQVKMVWKEIPFSLLAAIALLLLANFTFGAGGNPSINRLDGIFLFVLFILFMGYIFLNLRKTEYLMDSEYKILKPTFSIFLIIVGLVSLIVGSQLVVDNAVKIAQHIGMSEKIIGITIVSIGTSLPELVTSVVAAFRKKSDIAIGNIIGSNIFNLLLILGVSSIIKPITYNNTFNTDILLLIFSTLLLFGFMFSGKKYLLEKWESAILLFIYFGYITYLVM